MRSGPQLESEMSMFFKSSHFSPYWRCAWSWKIGMVWTIDQRQFGTVFVSDFHWSLYKSLSSLRHLIFEGVPAMMPDTKLRLFWAEFPNRQRVHFGGLKCRIAWMTSNATFSRKRKLRVSCPVCTIRLELYFIRNIIFPAVYSSTLVLVVIDLHGLHLMKHSIKYVMSSVEVQKRNCRTRWRIGQICRRKKVLKRDEVIFIDKSDGIVDGCHMLSGSTWVARQWKLVNIWYKSKIYT